MTVAVVDDGGGGGSGGGVVFVVLCCIGQRLGQGTGCLGGKVKPMEIHRG